MRIALASPGIATSVADGLERVGEMIAAAAAKHAAIVCFPEAYLPGLRGLDFPVPDFDEHQLAHVLEEVQRLSRKHGIATILGTEQFTERGRHIASVVIDATGDIQGVQAKAQIDPSEDAHYAPGSGRRLFEVAGVKFGISICHEGWRYPETVRWAAVRGAQVIFHPQHTGSDLGGVELTEWGQRDAPYYEKAMICRGLENTVYFASVNYGMRYQESATSIIDPSGECVAHLPYDGPGLLVHELDVSKATGLLALRFEPDRY